MTRSRTLTAAVPTDESTDARGGGGGRVRWVRGSKSANLWLLKKQVLGT